ncbi:MAG: hypothetical protein HWQ58_28145 [Nostoc sp. LPT]|nr:hypothetical protein [Nostoc sp. LPT]
MIIKPDDAGNSENTIDYLRANSLCRSWTGNAYFGVAASLTDGSSAIRNISSQSLETSF